MAKLEINDRHLCIKEQFKNHVLTVVQEDDNCKIYKFADPNTCNYSFTLICRGRMCMVYGDLGEWVWDCTWQTNLYNLPVGNRHYFMEKLSRQCKGIVFDSTTCEETLKELTEELVMIYKDSDEYTYDNELELRELISEAEIDDEWTYVCSMRKIIDELEDNFGFSDLWEFGLYQAGERIDSQLNAVLIGIGVAQEQAKLLEGVKE